MLYTYLISGSRPGTWIATYTFLKMGKVHVLIYYLMFSHLTQIVHVNRAKKRCVCVGGGGVAPYL
jgi:hypothetical protein